jgi:phosphoribosylformimino-5-aminoimidazole carboxamide ribotide isomerase
MIIYPAIDLLDGRCVRLLKGDYDEATTYHDDPVAQANEFVIDGAQWVHMVDLDAARSGVSTNLDAIRAVCAAVAVPVQVGGGVRSVDAAAALADAGVARVVIGTAAVERPLLVKRVAARQPVAVGLDARDGMIATHGWTETTALPVVEVARRFDDMGVACIVATDISRDGTMEGPDASGLVELLSRSRIPIIASGGVGALDDLLTLEALRGAGRRLDGVIIGRAIYEGSFTVKEALQTLAGTQS